MKLTSPDFGNMMPLPPRFTADGENTNPSFVFEEVPPVAKQLVIICHDPDAPSGDWTHWTAWNIPINTTHIFSGGVPSGVIEGVTDFGTYGYSGPAPPHGHGVHHYIFTLYALSNDDVFDRNMTRPQLLTVMKGKVLATADHIGLYERA